LSVRRSEQGSLDDTRGVGEVGPKGRRVGLVPHPTREVHGNAKTEVGSIVEKAE
jgi:hypothetical protein